MTCTAEVVAGANCIRCLEVVAVAAVAEQTVYTPIVGWTASARSSVSIAGDAYTEFSAPTCLGNVTGFATRYTSTNPVLVTHGFYLYRASGRELWAIIEASTVVYGPETRTPATDTYRIERRGSTVEYYVNGTFVYRSLTELPGEIFVMACLYSSGDGVN